MLGVFIFDKESAFLLDPLRELIRHNITAESLKTSGRALRVGVVSFWDGSYREIVLSDDELVTQQFLDYVLASTALPVLTEMPRIKEQPTQPADNDEWAQFADGGVRHTTPIVYYFYEKPGRSKVEPLLPFKSQNFPPHDDVKDVFVTVTFPAQRDTAVAARYDVSGRHYKSGKEILEISHRLSELEPTRWDVRFARLANAVLEWRKSVYERAERLLSPDEFRRFKKELNDAFPIDSYNRQSDWSLPYKLWVISPAEPLADPIENDDISAIIAYQLFKGCLAANDSLMAEGFGDFSNQCKSDLGSR